MALLQTAKKTAEITEDTLTILRHSILFQNLPERDLPLLLQTLQARSESYRKGQFLLHAGDRANAVGMVLKGHVSIIKDDFWGNENLLNRLGPGSIFAESFACAETVALNVSVTASSACEVLWLYIKELLHSTETSAVKDLFIRNFLQELAIKNLQFNEKMTHHSGKAAFLFIGCRPEKQIVRVQSAAEPTANGGLPLCGPQRAIRCLRQTPGRGYPDF